LAKIVDDLVYFLVRQDNGKYEIDAEHLLSDLGGSVPGFGDRVALTIHDAGSAFMEVVGRYFVRHLDESSGNEWIAWFIIVEPIHLPEADDLFDLISENYDRFVRNPATMRRESVRLPDPTLIEAKRDEFEWWVERDKERQKQGPKHRLDKPQMRALRFLASHPEIMTIDLVPQCGEKTMEALLKVGCVRPGGKDHRGFREWHITDEGRAEIKRDDTYKNWKF